MSVTITPDQFTDNASSTLASGITSTATSATVQSGDGAKFPGSYNYYCTLGPASDGSIEVVKVTNKSTDTFTIVRGIGGTQQLWASGASIWLGIPKAVLDNLWSASSTIATDLNSNDAGHYVLGQSGQSDSVLSNKVVIPNLSASPDIYVGGTNDWEFDSTSLTGWSSFAGGGAVSSDDANTTTKSHLTVNLASNAGADDFAGLIHAAPSTPFTMTAKLADWDPTTLDWTGIFVSDSSTAAGNTAFVGAAVVSGALGARGGTFTNLKTATGLASDTGRVGLVAPTYLRIVVHSAGNIDLAASTNGLVWKTLVTGLSLLSSAGYMGVAADANFAAGSMVFDWIRFT